ncbi:hypothetical protein AKO1_011220 [Acrasis kona]|uniref:Thioester reductase (TE) domain-containing protein n=1 Tax=Acrasis kona TaxID=1008807 RepID=A0AAW2YWK2_9EUKA
MFTGYFKQDNLTKQAFDQEGYYKTGDIVQIIGNRQFQLIDRKKNIFKLAQGEYVAPEALENTFLSSPLIDQIYVYGDISKSHVVAVVVPNQQLSTNHQEEEYLLIKELNRIGIKERLQPYEIPRAILIEREPFSDKNGKLTGTLKIARFYCEQHYKDRLNRLYNDQQQIEIEENISQMMNQSSTAIDSLHAVRIMSLIKKKYHVQVPIQIIMSAESSIHHLSSFVANHKKQLVVDWQQEIELPHDISTCSSATAQQLDLSMMDHVLLTGCTGYLGVYLLHLLLKNTAMTCKIYCIVRAQDETKAMGRIVEVIKTFGLNCEMLRKVIPIVGNLSSPKLGLSEHVYSELCQHVQIIFHNAAVVNSVASYQQLRSDNVEGTLQVLRLACVGRSKVFHHISTVGVMQGSNHGVIMEDDVEEHGSYARLNALSGYSQSKWVAEQLVRRARSRGLLTTIFRPGMIGCDSATGKCNLSDWVSRFIYGCVSMNMYPDTRGRTLSVLPVDHVAEQIINLSQNEKSLNRHCYHIVNQHDLSIDWMMECIAEVFEMKRVDYSVWREEVGKKCDLSERHDGALHEALWPLISLFGKEFPSRGCVFDNHRAMEDVPSYSKCSTTMSRELLQLYAKSVVSRNY